MMSDWGIVGSELSEAAWSVWAKYDRETDESMALHRHLLDSAAIAEVLWDSWLARSTRTLLTAAIGGDEADARALTAWLAGTHDIGKATPEFAKQVEPLAGRMRDAGLDFPPEVELSVRIPHSTMGHLLIEEHLRDRHGHGRVAARSFAVVAGGHHGTPPTMTELAGLKDRRFVLGTAPRWADVRAELLDLVTDDVKAAAVLDRLAEHPLPVEAQALLTAVVIVADWIASNVDCFPYGGDHAGDRLSSRERARIAWTRLSIAPAWRATVPAGTPNDLLRTRFGLNEEARARPVQSVAIAAADSLGASLVIIEAPMGEGKTEAALLAAESLAAQTGAGGCVVALPTMATSDAMFGRVLRWIERLPDARGPEQLQTAFLAHSKSALNTDFGRLKRLRGVGDDQTRSSREGDLPAAIVEAAQWLSGRKKGMLSNFVVGTIDQVLFSALKTKHVALRHLALESKVVVIDEVHTADAYMSVYLERVLAWLGAYGTPVVLLSATLAPSARSRLAGAYAAITDDARAGLEANTDYPLVTSVSSRGVVRMHPVEPSARVADIGIEWIDDDEAALIEEIDRALTAGAAVGVIRNTVRRAQETARLLRARFGSASVTLAHSRFIATDRREIEAELRRRLGPPSGDSQTGTIRGPHVYVGTQVLEQSLDIDFDLMITDIAPVDLVLQRSGRLHRHDRRRRPVGYEHPRLLITGVERRGDDPPALDAGAHAVYGDHLLLRTVLALDAAAADTGSITLPSDLSPLVRAVYDGDLDAPAGWTDALATARAKWDALLSRKRTDAGVFALDAPDRCGSTLIDWLKASAVDVDEDSPSGQQQVRDTEDSVEVLVAQMVDGAVHLLPWLPAAERPLETRTRPDDDQAWWLATSSIRLPPQLCRGRALDTTIGALETNAFEGWQQSALLKGQLILVLDERLEAHVGSIRVNYSRIDGLSIVEPETSSPAEGASS